ncbi:hypothetical protein FYJ28_04390 [Arthrobacter sp. BL-252-APC-1A]|uniref:hypothetical protein n=1 Tax=Arthrobacter sp. BL-252-APC-1A TaxID=2606622 RepID=UPI0012B3D764|nr:hypothetical protein [Arthrobacter sp. BL-252-APC-1A]MSR98059.1 hypothetical protein [Arthrobacter sp. BL-252-APC-1A]
MSGGLISEVAAGLVVPRPEGWEQLDAPADSVVLAHPPVPEGHFRPNLVLRRSESDSVSLPRLSTAALGGTLVLPGTHIISNELWHQQLDPQGALVEGRRQRFVRVAEGQVVCVDRWLFSDCGGSLEATASYALEQHTGMRPLFEDMVFQMRRAAPVAAGAPASPAGAQPRLDPAASRLLQTAAEDLAPLRAEQRHRVRGQIIGPESLSLLLSMANRDALGRFDAAGAGESAAQLQALGLLDGRRLTPSGRAFVQPLRGLQAQFTVSVVGPDGSTGMDAWLGAGSALVAAGPSASEIRSTVMPLGSCELLCIDAAALPVFLAKWLPLVPAWTAGQYPLRLSGDLFEHRLNTGSDVEAPEGLGEAEARMWAQPWVGWNVEHVHSGRKLGWVTAGDAGPFLATADPRNGGVALEPEPASAVWDTLVDFILAAAQGAFDPR